MSQFRLEVFVKKELLGDVMEFLLQKAQSGHVHVSGCDLVEIQKQSSQPEPKLLKHRNPSVLSKARPVMLKIIEQQTEPFKISMIKIQLQSLVNITDSSFWGLVREMRDRGKIVKMENGSYEKVV